MARNISGRFASRKNTGEPSFKFDLKTAVVVIVFLVFLLDTFGLYPKARFNFFTHSVLYILFFAAIYFLERSGAALGLRAQNRLVYALGIVYLTLACISGGVASPLKWAPLILAIILFSSRDFKTGAILLAGAFLGFVKDYALFTMQDVFIYAAAAGFAVIIYFRGARRDMPSVDGEALRLVETNKESKHFKFVIFNLLESLFSLYHAILRPVSIMLFMKNDEEGGAFCMTMSVSTKESEIIKDYRFDIKEGVLGNALSKTTFFAFDVKGVRMPYYSGKVDVVCAATIPVVLDTVIGAVALDFDRDIEAEKETIKERLRDLTVEVVNIMELYDINHKVITKEQRVSRMYEINEKLNLMEGKSGLMQNFMNEIKSFDIYSGYLAEYSAEDNAFEITESFNYPAAVKGVKFNAREDGILRYVMGSGKSMVIDDAANKNIPLNFKRLNLDKNFICLLKSGNNVMGFIKLDKEKPFVFSEFEIRTLEIMLSRITVMLENAKLYEKIRNQAFHDGLTGLLNHLTFQERLRESVEKKDKGELRCVSVCVIDIDFFKKFNDSFGHQEGDRVLVKLAGVLSEFTKRYERTYCARYGGEEFVFVLEDYDIYAAAKVAEEIRKFSADTLKGGNEKEKRPIYLSIGATSFPEFARDARELFKQADDALYIAKEEGRNTVKTILDVRKVDRRKK